MGSGQDGRRVSRARLSRRHLLQTGVGLGVGSKFGITTASAQQRGGVRRWRFETGDGVDSSPTVVGGTVYVGSEDNNLYAIAVDSGSERWRFETRGVVDSSPTVVDGTVYVGSYDGSLYAIDADSGTEQWRFGSGGFVSSSPTVVDGTVYVGRYFSLYAVDASSGAEQWHFETGAPVWSSPTVVDGTVYVGSNDNNLYAVEAGSGAKQWQFGTGESVVSSPTVVDGTVYVGSYDRNLYAIDADSGTERWRFETESKGVISSPTVADGTVYVGGDDGNLYAVDASSGTERWRFRSGGSLRSSPTVADGIVYVGSKNNNLYAVGASSGLLRWRFETGGIVQRSSPTVADGTVYIGSSDTYLYAVDAGVAGSSEGSRVRHRTLGHHDKTDVFPANGGGEGSDDEAEDPVDAAGFDPAIHGFGFENWGESGAFVPRHDHQTIAEETFRTQFDEEWLPDITEAYPYPLPDPVTRALLDALFDTLRNGPESIYSDGHCYGMCLVAQEYFEDGVPDSLPAGIETAAAIDKPTGDYAVVGREIDDRHRSQTLDSSTVLQLSHRIIDDAPIDAEAEVRAIQTAIEDQGTALVGIGTSPTEGDQQFAHQVIAYNVELDGGDSVADAESARLAVYDPNEAAEYYDEDSRQLEIDISGPSVLPLTNNDRAGYRFVYHRFGLVGPSRTDLLGAINFGYRLVRDLIDSYLDGLMTITARSPVRIDAVAPDGRQFEHPERPVEGTPPSELVYLTDTTSGEYEIHIKGTADGEYTLDILGSVPEGGLIEESVTETISEGETQRITANLPADPTHGTLTDTPGESGGDGDSEDDTENPLGPPGMSNRQDGRITKSDTPTRSVPRRRTEDDAGGRETPAEPTTDASVAIEATDETTDRGGPGFGIVGALVSLGGAGYLLRDRLTGDDRDS